jgi:hypothetical protein
MGDLLNEYERGIESTTELIRNHAVNFKYTLLIPQFQSSIRTTQLHQEYNQKLHSERMENEQLQAAVIEAEARLIKISGLLRQAHFADHQADRDVDQALLDLQAQNKGLRQALDLSVGPPNEIEKDLEISAVEETG